MKKFFAIALIILCGFSSSIYAVPKKYPSHGERTFVFYPQMTMWGAYNERGDLVAKGRASGGKSYCPDIRRSCKTPQGYFQVYRKGSYQCRSKKFPIGRGGAPMPYCMFFYHGYAIHGSPHVPGYNASHGCIRVQPPLARWLSRNFIQEGTRVIVKSY